MFPGLEHDVYYSALEAYDKPDLIRLFEGYSIPLYETIVSHVDMLLYINIHNGKVNTILHTKITAKNSLDR